MADGTAKSGQQHSIEIKAGRDVDPEVATGTKSHSLQEDLIMQAVGTVWQPQGVSEEKALTRVKAALAALERIKPQDEMEGMLAAQMVATHSAAMECYRRAMLPGQTFAGRDQNLKHGAKLTSIYLRQLEVLDKRRGKGHQKVTVEHVHVEAGGQAIVGTVEAGGGERRHGTKTPAVEHTTEAPFEAPAPAKARKTKARR